FSHVFAVELDQLPAALLLGAAGNREIVNGRHQPPLALDQLLLVLLEQGDIRADGDGAAVAGLELRYLLPASVGELALIGDTVAGVGGSGDPAFVAHGFHARLDVPPVHAGHDLAAVEAGILDVLAVAHHQPFRSVPKDEGFGDVLDRGAQPLIGNLRLLHEGALLGHVHGDANQVDFGRIRVHDLRPCARPYPA